MLTKDQKIQQFKEEMTEYKELFTHLLDLAGQSPSAVEQLGVIVGKVYSKGYNAGYAHATDESLEGVESAFRAAGGLLWGEEDRKVKE